MPLPVVLMYHSVDDRRGRSDIWGLSVSPDNFASQIEALTSERTVVPLEDLARYVCAGRVPRGLAAITFDDGYMNNAIAAKPILDRYSTPATLFYMTAAADCPGFWWDRLERIIMEARSPPEALSIPLAPQALEIRVQSADRRQTYMEVWSRMRRLDPEARERAIAHLSELLQVEPDDPQLRPMTLGEVERLDGDLFSIGAHTHTHPSLPLLGHAEMAREIAGSKAICERRLGRKVTAFAYPFGDYDDRVRAVTAEAGLTFACTTAPRAVRPDDDCLTLPRVGVGNWTGEELLRHLPRGDGA